MRRVRAGGRSVVDAMRNPFARLTYGIGAVRGRHQQPTSTTPQHDHGSQSPSRAYKLVRVSSGTAAEISPETDCDAAQVGPGRATIPPLPSITAEMPPL